VALGLLTAVFLTCLIPDVVAGASIAPTSLPMRSKGKSVMQPSIFDHRYSKNYQPLEAVS
jgi:hypothetical protein